MTPKRARPDYGSSDSSRTKRPKTTGDMGKDYYKILGVDKKVRTPLLCSEDPAWYADDAVDRPTMQRSNRLTKRSILSVLTLSTLRSLTCAPDSADGPETPS